MTDALRTALDLADSGIPVFPCSVATKAPLIAKEDGGRGHNDASIDPTLIRAWWSKYPDALIGVPTGRMSGFDALDLDPRHGAADWLRENADKLPTTRTNKTRSGGLHLLFQAQPGLRCATDNPAPGCDIRADGGYIIWWPAHGFPPAKEAPVAPWPAWLLADILRHQPAVREGAKAAHELAPPSWMEVVKLLDVMPNPLATGRDEYIQVMLAARGCIQGLDATGAEPGSAEIAAAAVRWAERWEGYAGADEAAKWESDFARRDAPLAGWENLRRHAARLIPGYTAAIAAEEFAAAPMATEDNPEAWHSKLFRTEKGAPEAGLANAGIAFRSARDWRGVLAYDAFASRVMLRAGPPWSGQPARTYPSPVTDDDFTRAAEWLRRQGIKATSNVAGEAMSAVARENSYHPVRDYLSNLAWDGEPRIDTWLIDHLGAADTALNRAFGARFLISAVARVMRPGCQVDTVLLLEGEQGLRKSTCLRVLFGDDWFTDQVPDLRNKDALAQLRGKWCQEHAEMTALSRSDVASIKNYVSARIDRFRPAYGRVAEDFPRECVFAATLNPAGSGYLRDETGARRFWPVACGVGWPPGKRADSTALEPLRNQMWAEALARYECGEPWYLDSRELEMAQGETADERYDSDAWEDTIGVWLSSKLYVTMDDVLIDALRIAPKDQTRGHQMRAAAALHKLGWLQARKRLDGRILRVYFPPGGGHTGIVVELPRQDGAEALAGLV